MPDFYVYILIGVITLFVVLPLRKLQAAILLQKQDYYVVIREFRLVEPNDRGKGKKIESRHEHCFDSYHAARAFFDMHEKWASKPSYEDRQQINYFYVIPAYSASDAISKMNKPLTHTGSFHHEAQYLAETPSSTLVDLKRHWDWERQGGEPSNPKDEFDRQREKIETLKSESWAIYQAAGWNHTRKYFVNAENAFNDEERALLKELYNKHFAHRDANEKSITWSNILYSLNFKYLSLDIEAIEEELIFNWAKQDKFFKDNKNIDNSVYGARIKMQNRKLKKQLKVTKNALKNLSFEHFLPLDQKDEEQE